MSRLQLTCLLKACKATQQQLNQVCASQEDDGTDDCVATDLDKLEEHLWRDNDKDDFSSDVETRKDKGDEDNFLNDDDIEEIMIFQTQSLKRKNSEEGKNLKEKQSPLSPRLSNEQGILSIGVMSNALQENASNSLGNHSLLEKTKEKSLTCFGEDKLSRNPAKKGHLSHNPIEMGNLSHNSDGKGNLIFNPAEEGNLLCNPVALVNLSHNSIEMGNLSHNSDGKGNLIFNPSEEGNLLCNPVALVNLSHNPTKKVNLPCDPVATVDLSQYVGTDTLSRNSVDNRESIPPCGQIEEMEKEKLIVLHEKRNVNKEEIAKNEWLSPQHEHMIAKELPPASSWNKTDGKKQVASANSKEKVEILTCDERVVSRDSQERGPVRSHSSSSEWACVEIDEPISDSDDIKVQALDHVQGGNERYALERQLGRRDEGQNCHVNEELSNIDETDGKDFEEENNADFTNMSIDFLNDDPAVVEDGNITKLDEVGGIQETLSDFQPLESNGLDLPLLGSYKEADGLPLPTGEERWDDEQDLQGSPREVTLLDDDEVEEAAVNESITLISDNDEEVCVVVFNALTAPNDLSP